MSIVTEVSAAAVLRLEHPQSTVPGVFRLPEIANQIGDVQDVLDLPYSKPFVILREGA